jgi:hypothetical protein
VPPVPNPRSITLPAPSGFQFVNAGIAVPTWSAYASPPPGIRLGIDLSLPDTTNDWTTFYSGTGWSVPAGQLWSVALNDGWLAMTLKSEIQAAIASSGHSQVIWGSSVQLKGGGTWEAVLQVHDPTLGYLGDLIIDVAPGVTAPGGSGLPHGITITACVSTSESVGLEVKAILIGLLLGGVISGVVAAIIGAVVFGVVAAILAGTLGKNVVGGALNQAELQGSLPSCSPPTSNNCVTCAATPALIVPGAGLLDPTSFYPPSGYLALGGGVVGTLTQLTAPKLAAAVLDWSYPFVPCQGLGSLQLPILITNTGQLPALVCSIAQRTVPGDPPPVLKGPQALPILFRRAARACYFPPRPGMSCPSPQQSLRPRAASSSSCPSPSRSPPPLNNRQLPRHSPTRCALS